MRAYWSRARSQVVGVDSIVRRTRRGRGCRLRPIGRTGRLRVRAVRSWSRVLPVRRGCAGSSSSCWRSRDRHAVVEGDISGRGRRLRWARVLRSWAPAPVRRGRARSWRLLGSVVVVRVYWSRPAPVRRGRAVLVVLVDSCGSAGRRGAAVSRAVAAPLVVRLGVVRSCSAPPPSRSVPLGAHSLTR